MFMLSEEIIPLICDALERYPLSEPQDIVKLLYQREFGPAHAIADPASARRFLEEEYASVPQEEGLPFEYVGNGCLRLHLSRLDHNGISVEAAARLFIESAEEAGDKTAFAAMLKELAEDGFVTELMPGLAEFISRYIASGCPALRHSEAYRAAYRTAYRVIRGELLVK